LKIIDLNISQKISIYLSYPPRKIVVDVKDRVNWIEENGGSNISIY